MTRLLLVLFFFSLAQMSHAQLEENSMVLYAKANVLMESARYDEAVRLYNQILRADENHTNALHMRAKAKLELGYPKGTKQDMMTYIEKVGVDKKVLDIMAVTELQLGNLKAAENYANTKLEMDPFDDDMFVVAGDIYMEMAQRNDACEHFSLAANLGNTKAKRKIDEYCDGYTARKRTNTSMDNDIMMKEEEVVVATEDNMEEESTKKSDDGVISLEEIVKDAEEDPNLTPIEDREPTPTYNGGRRPTPTATRVEEVDVNASQTVELDDNLSVSFADGLGDRSVTSKPNIFMLSDQDGEVVIDLCVDDNGKVTEAVFNRNLSTIYRSSLTSLALRKAKEFVFNARNLDEQCGRLTYHIKA